MNSKIKLPDYNNSIFNVIISILKHFNVESKYNGIEKLDNILNDNKKNIVFILLDGMGSNLIDKISPNNFFMKNKISNLTSIYPSTTTSVLNSLYSAKPPIETGWIAWSQYFKEYGRSLDMFKKQDSYTEEIYKNAKIDVFKSISYKNIFEQIKEKNNKVKTYEINPNSCESRANVTLKTDTIEDMCSAIMSICSNDENNFIFAYINNPDELLHKNGCDSTEVKNFLLQAEIQIENMCNKLRNTTIIISADHGHNDIKKRYNILEMDEINRCLIMPPSFESRCPTFWVKEDKKEDFEKEFNKIFKKEFILYTKKEFLDKHFLGYGQQHEKIDDFIGNYIALSVKDSIIEIKTSISADKYMKLSTHCGLTENEMIIPLIVKQL